MGLRDQHAAGARTHIEDLDGFGWPITVTAPDATSLSMVGLSTDIEHTLDPDTGLPVAGRRASVALSLQSLTAGGLGVPRGVASPTAKPWVVSFDDIQGNAHTFKVSRAYPDRAIGIVTCELEQYTPL